MSYKSQVWTVVGHILLVVESNCITFILLSTLNNLVMSSSMTLAFQVACLIFATIINGTANIILNFKLIFHDQKIILF